MHAVAVAALLCGCAPAIAPAMSIVNNSGSPPHAGGLDQLRFLDGCWVEETRGFATMYRLCWSREAGRWHGSLTVRLRGHVPDRTIHYMIDDSPNGPVLEYSQQGTVERVLASSVEDHAICFRRPDPPGRRWRGPDLALRVHSTELWVAIFDEIHSFQRALLARTSQSRPRIRSGDSSHQCYAPFRRQRYGSSTPASEAAGLAAGFAGTAVARCMRAPRRCRHRLRSGTTHSR
jgi:hypothetical protein